MGSFYDEIEGELNALDAKHTPHFGTDYNTNTAVVAQVQAAINAAGYTPALTVDGAYGPATQAGVQWVQAKDGVATDGIIGDQTLGSLGISPPGGTSVDSVTGAVKGAAAAAVAAIQQQYSALMSWAGSNPQPITQGSGVAPGFQGTRAAVVNSYTDWTTPLEGFVPWMYIDALGYVTTGMGNLIDPISTALTLPWKNSDGSTATQQQITDAWNAVDSKRSDPKGTKQSSGPGAQGGGTQGGLTTLRITKDDIKQLVASKMLQNETYLMQGLTGYANAPADAQLAVHSMAWAMGPGFAKSGWPGFVSAFNSGDYKTAATQSKMQGTGIDRRNDANALLLNNAAQVIAAKKSPDYLYYIDGLAQLYASGVNAWIAKAKANPIATGGIVAGVLTAIVGGVIALKKS